MSQVWYGRNPCPIAAAVLFLVGFPILEAFQGIQHGVHRISTLTPSTHVMMAGGEVHYHQGSALYQQSSSSSSPSPPPSPPNQRKARRDLVKRGRRRSSTDGGGGGGPTASRVAPTRSPSISGDIEYAVVDDVEVRPLVRENAQERGLDYWMDESEVQRVQERERIRKERFSRRSPSQVPDEKLRGELVSPYKQNWIGLISVSIIVLSFIVTNFPELAEAPRIPIPDL